MKKQNANMKKHYFLLVVDSLSSFRLLDSIEMFKRNNDIDKKNNKDLLNFFNGFDIKLNTLSPGFATETGFSGTIGGAAHSSTNTQMKKISHTKDIFNSAWETVINDFANSEEIEKIYLSYVEYYNLSKDEPQRITNNIKSANDIKNIVNKEKLVFIPTNPKDERSYFADSFSRIVEKMDKDKSSFSIMKSDIVHDIWTPYYVCDKSWDKTNSLFNMLLKMKKELLKKEMWDNSCIVIVSDHGKQCINFDTADTTFYSLLKQIKYKSINLDKRSKNYNDIVNENFHDFSKVDEAITHMASILFKDFSASGEMTIDYKNSYMNFDAIGFLYNKAGIGTENIDFNWKEYIPGINPHNPGGDYNSSLKLPIKSDLSNRKLFTMMRNTDWGVQQSLLFGKNIFIWKNPLFYQKHKKWFIKKDSLKKYILDEKANKKIWEKPLLYKEIMKRKTEKEQMEVFGDLINDLFQKE